MIGQSIDVLETPQLLIDLDLVDTNLTRMFDSLHQRGLHARVHFKSLKCTGLAHYIQARGADGFLCAKLNEAEALVNAGLIDVFIANEIIGPIKLRRLAELARKAAIRVCVDDPGNIQEMSKIAQETGVTLGVLVELDIGMNRCGVEPGEPGLHLARQIANSPGLRFVGLQGYQGQLQMLTDVELRTRKSREGLQAMLDTRKLIEQSGIPCPVVTGGGTGTWDVVASFDGMTELQPGSFVLMDAAYQKIQPGFGCSLSILATVISRRPTWYVLDAGSKAISQDFGSPEVKHRPGDTVLRLAEEHAKVETADTHIKVGDRVEVFPAHCCATMNLHRQCFGVRKGKIETVWPIEASGRYD